MEDIILNPTEPVNVVPEFVDLEIKKLEESAKATLDKIIVRVPIAASAVEIVDTALAGVACSCGLFGWILSASRSRHSPAKPAVLSSEVPK